MFSLNQKSLFKFLLDEHTKTFFVVVVPTKLLASLMRLSDILYSHWFIPASPIEMNEGQKHTFTLH